ncbi:MAG TPA: hypothetical protein VMV49_02560 [Candidatus Deferrimicrobium sp.]|nr:hypothetical protein [Candidatus Deferrimicrobium sp.]
MKGIETAEISIKMAKKIKDDFAKNFKISKAYEEIGGIYETIQDYQKAIKFFNDALNILEKSIEDLFKRKEKLTPEDFTKNTVLSRSLYVDYLKRLIELFLKLQDEKKAKECITKPFNKYLKTKDPNYLELLTYLADINLFLADKLKNNEELIKGIGELIIIDFFAKKFSEDKKYWSNKIHLDIKEKSQLLVEILKIPVDEQILGKETLNILKEIELETKDHMYIDKLLDLKKQEDPKDKITKLIEMSGKIKADEASTIVLTMAENELIMSLAQANEYTEAFQKAKDIVKDIKKIKNKMVQYFMLGEVQLNLFRVNVRRQDYKQAEKEAKKAIDYFEENLNTLAHTCFTILELASCYMIQNQFNKAETLLEKPLDLCEQIGSSEFLARLYELLAGIKLKLNDSSGAAINFSASALFYLISNDTKKYQEFLTLAINLYNTYLKSIGFSGIEF